LDLFQKVIKKDHSVFPDKQRTLCERFANGLCDPFMQKEAKRLLRSNHGHMDFYTLRDEIILFSEEETTQNNSKTPLRLPDNKPPQTISEQPTSNIQTQDSSTADQLLKVIHTQQRQIDSLINFMRDSGTGQHYTERRRKHPPKYYRCGKLGHIQKYCPDNANNDSENK
jgi:hypothetical protein